MTKRRRPGIANAAVRRPQRTLRLLYVCHQDADEALTAAIERVHREVPVDLRRLRHLIAARAAVTCEIELLDGVMRTLRDADAAREPPELRVA
jgi:hypothetical protein